MKTRFHDTISSFLTEQGIHELYKEGMGASFFGASLDEFSRTDLLVVIGWLSKENRDQRERFSNERDLLLGRKK